VHESVSARLRHYNQLVDCAKLIEHCSEGAEDQ